MPTSSAWKCGSASASTACRAFCSSTCTTRSPTAGSESLWLALILFVFTIAELLLSPVGLSVTTKLAPAAFHTQMVALFYLSISLGTAVAGEVAKLYDPTNEVPYFLILGIGAIAAGLLLMLAAKPVLKLLRGVR